MFFTQRRQSGFTLIELLVVMAIIGLLASVTLSVVETARVKARNARKVTMINEYRTTFERIAIETEEYPDPLNTIRVCLGDYPDDKCWRNTGTELNESAILNDILDDYIPSLPADTTILGDPDDTSYQYEGAYYRCVPPRTNNRCLQYEVYWIMEGIGESCIGEDVAAANYLGLEMTLCRMTRTY